MGSSESVLTENTLLFRSYQATIVNLDRVSIRGGSI